MAWQDEKKELLATIRRQEQEAVALARRFKLLQQTLKEQQKLLDRYQRALGAVDATFAIDTKRKVASTHAHEPVKKHRREATERGDTSLSMDQTWVQRTTLASTTTSAEAPGLFRGKQPMNEKKTAILTPVVQRRHHSGLASTWAEEKQKILTHAKWKQTRALAASGTADKENLQTEQTSDCPKAFAYIEVVRNREERQALMGHDCIECKKYYDALGEIETVDAAAQKHKCSRHRARFEPYQTPDDFWRLSFPDSVPQ